MCGSCRCLTQAARIGSTYRRDLLLFLPRNGEAGDHLAQFLAGGDVADPDFAKLPEVEKGQALGKQLAVNDALAEARINPETDAARELVESGADALQIVRLNVLQAVAKDDPVDAFPGRFRAGRAAVPDQLG